MSLFARLLLAAMIPAVIIIPIVLAMAVFLNGCAIDEVLSTLAVRLPMIIGLLLVLAIIVRIIFRRLF